MTAALVLALAPVSARAAESTRPIDLVLWHTYSGAEQDALGETVAKFNGTHPGVHLSTLPIPYDAMADKLTAAIALGKGPDLFVYAHDRLGDWAAQGLVEPLQNWTSEETLGRFAPGTLAGLCVPQGSRSLYGLPLAVKAVALVYDGAKVKEPPRTLEELATLARGLTSGGSYGLVFDWGNTYTEAGFLHAFGGGVLDASGSPTLDAPGNALALTWARSLREGGLLPKEISGALVGSLFNDRRAAMIVTGPWALRDLEKSIDVRVAVLPLGPSGPVRPFASIEALILSSRSAHKREAFEALLALTSDESARLRLEKASQPVANLASWTGTADAALTGFHAQATSASVPMPNAPAMRHVWTPMDAALSRIFGQSVRPEEALVEAQRRVTESVRAAGEGDSALEEGAEELAAFAHSIVARPDPLPASEDLRAAVLRFERGPSVLSGRWRIESTNEAMSRSLDRPGAGGAAGHVFKALADLADQARPDASPAPARSGETLAVSRTLEPGRVLIVTREVPARGRGRMLIGLACGLLLLAAWAFARRERLRPHTFAYACVVPACAALVVLVFVPFSYGMSLSFYDVSPTRERFVGLRNFLDIVLLRNRSDAHGFYFTFAMTVLWTVVNVALHLVVGLFLALLLQDPRLRLRKVYRVLLIVPWAIPNYITGLIWKAMFNAEYGLVNRVLGLGAFSWFERPATAFLANLVTNVWLGFPFMMVTALGALQSIPAELYEAAEMDGAGRVRKFVDVTLPLLKPALFPAVILGTIWTFNLSFNVIYLVSGGAPDGATDILVTQAFRYAFEQYRYGYAAAYATLIFGVLLGYTAITNRITRATEGAFE